MESAGVPVSEACPALDLRLPNGEPLELTGQWQADDFGIYYFSHVQSCLHWLGQSQIPNEEPPGSFWTNVFIGRIESDFTVEGPWSDVPYGDVRPPDEPLNNGVLTLEIEFVEVDGVTRPTLHLTNDATLHGVGSHDFVPLDSLDPRAEFTGTYGYDNDPVCPWLDVNGQRYELNQWQWLIAEEGQILTEDGILARPGDQIRVEAQISAPLGPLRCQASAMLAWDLAPAP
jgi:hypothetical protein